MRLRQGGMRGARRRGHAALWALLSLTVMLAALALALNAGWLGTGFQQLQAAADSAVLAGTGELVSDEWLRKGRPGVGGVLQNARLTARDYAGRNGALGQVVQLRLAPQPDGDVVLGTITSTGTFAPVDTSNPSSLSLDQLNAVGVAARRLRARGNGVPILLGALLAQPAADLQAQAVARLDRDVIGFRARASNPIPLVPIGLLSDPSGANPLSWESQVPGGSGLDEYTFDPSAGFTPGADGIVEFDLALQLDTASASAGNAYLLHVGTGEPVEQVAAGVSEQDLADSGGQLVLDATNKLLLPAGSGPAANSADYQTLREGLEQLRTQRLVRIYPLVASFDQATGKARVNAFVAARVVRIEQVPNGPLQVRLQQAMLSVPQALTDAARSGVAHFVPNPYLGRTRLVR